MDNNKSILEIKNLFYSIEQKQILTDINFSVQNGEFLFSCEISPNGGVRYFNEFLSVVVFGAQKYDENGT